jgi:sterol desaturase/sphingolipid hydroxylase (fatty acid hydroxylase superfamily)
MTEQALPVIRVLYEGTFLGLLVFLLLWEGGQAKVEFVTARARITHVLRNLGLFAFVVLLADYVIGQGLVPSSSLLLRTSPFGLALYKSPLFLQVLLAFLASDLLDYGLHRASHRVGWLWRLHSVHHSDSHLDATTALRAHPVEVSLQIVCKVALYAALGLPLWIEGVRSIAHNAFGLFQHANVHFPAWMERLRPVFVTPALHRVHHDVQPTLHDTNFGFIFSFWDRLFGTYSLPAQVSLGRVGLKGYEDEPWQTLSGMLLTPIRRFPDPPLDIGTLAR